MQPAEARAYRRTIDYYFLNEDHKLPYIDLATLWINILARVYILCIPVVHTTFPYFPTHKSKSRPTELVLILYSS